MKPFYTPSFDKRGHCKLSTLYKEILVLNDLLEEAAIPFSLHRNFDGWQILYPPVASKRSNPWQEKTVCSVIQHYGSYGGMADKLEIMGLLTPEEAEYDAVKGNMTAQEVFERIKAHWEKDDA